MSLFWAASQSVRDLEESIVQGATPGNAVSRGEKHPDLVRLKGLSYEIFAVFLA
jgi:hypothetical protein